MSEPIVHFSRRYRLSASHRLHAPALSDLENQETYGKCNNPHGHGHNYSIEITVAGPVSAETGFVVDLVALDALVWREILDRFDHASLNQDAAFAGDRVPSTENLAIEIERVLASAIADLSPNGTLHLVNLHIEETRNNAFDLPATGFLDLSSTAKFANNL